MTWPSGLVQSLSGLEAGRVHAVEEPPTIVVTPWERRLDKDGPTSAFVEVYARTSEGALRTGAELTLTIAYGIGTLAGPGQDHEGGRRWEIPPPGVAGSTVVRAEIDGVPVTIRPRIFWE